MLFPLFSFGVNLVIMSAGWTVTDVRCVLVDVFTQRSIFKHIQKTPTVLFTVSLQSELSPEKVALVGNQKRTTVAPRNAYVR